MADTPAAPPAEDPAAPTLTDGQLAVLAALFLAKNNCSVSMLPFETSQPGLFAVGDLRSGSMKRVALAVGEGSAAIRSVHEHLAVPT